MSDRAKGFFALLLVILFPIFAFFLAVSQPQAQDNGLSLLGVSLTSATNTPTPTPTATATPSSFNAADYGTVLAWYDMSDTTKVKNVSDTQATNGQVITKVLDKGTIGGDATATTIIGPVLRTGDQNGLQVAELSGVAGSFFQMDTGKDITKNLTAVTVAIVYKVDAVTASQSLIEFQDNGADHRLKLYHEFNPNQWTIITKHADADSTQDKYSGGGNPVSAATWYVSFWVLDISGNAVKMWANGTSKINTTLTGSGGYSNTDSLESPVIGASDLYGTQLMDGKVGDAVVWSGAMNDTNRDNAETSLGTKWNISVS